MRAAACGLLFWYVCNFCLLQWLPTISIEPPARSPRFKLCVSLRAASGATDLKDTALQVAEKADNSELIVLKKLTMGLTFNNRQSLLFLGCCGRQHHRAANEAGASRAAEMAHHELVAQRLFRSLE